MRLFLLPVSTRRTLIYCEKVKLTDGVSYTDWAVNKASTTWTKWEKAEKGWQKKLTVYGNEIFRRIPFEEWGLKTLPSLSKVTLEKAGPTKVLFPGAFLDKSLAPGVLKAIATERQGLHKSKLFWSIVAMPFTAPVALIPVIPNIPFLYLVFRAYSHYKALYGSRYLESLLDKKLITMTPSTTLDQIYAAGLIHSNREQSRKATGLSEADIQKVALLVKSQADPQAEDVMVLKSWNGKLLAERFGLPEMEVEIERAVEQVEKSIEKAATAKREKAAAISSTPEPDTKQD